MSKVESKYQPLPKTGAPPAEKKRKGGKKSKKEKPVVIKTFQDTMNNMYHPIKLLPADYAKVESAEDGFYRLSQDFCDQWAEKYPQRQHMITAKNEFQSPINTSIAHQNTVAIILETKELFIMRNLKLSEGPVHTFEEFPSAMDFSDDGKSIYFGFQSGKVIQYLIETEKTRAFSLEGEIKYLVSFRASLDNESDGRRFDKKNDKFVMKSIAVVFADNQVKFYSNLNFELRNQLNNRFPQTLQGKITRLTRNFDFSRLLVFSYDNTKLTVIEDDLTDGGSGVAGEGFLAAEWYEDELVTLEKTKFSVYDQFSEGLNNPRAVFERREAGNDFVIANGSILYLTHKDSKLIECYISRGRDVYQGRVELDLKGQKVGALADGFYLTDGKFLYLTRPMTFEKYFSDRKFDGDKFVLTKDSKYLLTLFEGDISVWDFNTKKLYLDIAAIHGRIDKILFILLDKVDSVYISGDNRFILSWNKDKELKLYNLEKKKLATNLSEIIDEYSELKLVDISEDGRYVALVYHKEKSIQIWSIETKTLHHTFQNTHAESPSHIKFGTGHTLISAFRDSIKIWNIETKKELGSILAPHQKLTNLNVSADGKLIISTGSEKIVKFWNITTKNELYRIASNESITHVTLSNDNTFVLLKTETSAQLWNYQSKSLITTLPGFNVPKVEDPSAPDAQKLARPETIYFTPDNTQLIFDDNGVISVFHIEVGHAYHEITEPEGEVSEVLVNPDNKSVLWTFMNDGALKTASIVDNTHQLGFSEYHKGRITAAAYAFGGKTIISIDDTNEMRIWDVENKKLTKAVPNVHSAGVLVNLINVTSDNKYVVFGTHDRFIKFYNLNTNKFEEQIKDAHKSNLNCLAIAPDYNFLFTAGDKSIIKWSFLTKRKTLVLNDAHSDIVCSIAVTGNEKHLISACAKDHFNLWNLETSQLVQTFKDSSSESKNFFLDNSKATYNSVQFSPDDQLILAASHQEVGVWNLDTRQFVYKYSFNKVVNKFRLSLDSRFLVTLHEKKVITVSRFLNNDLSDKPKIQALPKRLILTSNQDFTKIITSTENNIIKVLNPVKAEAPETIRVPAEAGVVRALAFSKDDKLIAVGHIAGESKSIAIYNQESMQENEDLKISFYQSVYGLQFSEDNERLFVLTRTDLKLYSFRDGAFLPFSAKHDGRITAFKALGNLIITAGMDFSLKIWTINDGEAVESFVLPNAHKSKITNLAISEDGTTLYSSSMDKSVHIWNIAPKASSKIELELKKPLEYIHPGGITAIALSADGSILATGSEDGCVKVWTTGNCAIQFNIADAHTAPVNGLALSRDGKNLITISSDGHMKLYNPEKNTLLNPFIEPQPEARNRFVPGLLEKPKEMELPINFIKNAIPLNTHANGYSLRMTPNPELFQSVKNIPNISELTILPHNWNILHYCAILHPEYIEDFPDGLKISHAVDIYGKTPIHYMLAQTPHEYESINRVFHYIIQFLESSQCSQEERRKTMDSFRDLLPFIFSKISPAGNLVKFLKLCQSEPQLQHGQELEYIGETGNNKSHSKYVLSDNPIVTQDNIETLYKKDGSNKLKYRSTNIGMDFNLNSDDTVNFLLFLKSETKRYLFEDEFITSVLGYYWELSRKYLKRLFAIFSIIMILLSIQVSLAVDRNGLSIAIIVLSALMMLYELLQANLKGFGQYFKSVSSMFNFLYLVFLIITMILEIRGVTNNDLIPWMETICLLFGYIRWISFLRLFNKTRYLIRLAIVIMKDMKPFIVVIGFIIFGFSFMLMSFHYAEGVYLQNLYNAYFLLFNNQLGYGEISSSLKVLSILFPFVLNIVFLRFLISTMGDSVDKVMESRVYTDNKEKIDIILEFVFFLRMSKRKVGPRQYLIHSEHDRSDEQGEWDGKVNYLRKAIDTRSQELRSIMQEYHEETRKAFVLAEASMEETKKELRESIKRVEEDVKEFSRTLKENVGEEVDKRLAGVIQAVKELYATT